MRNILLFSITLFLFYPNTLFAQDNSCNLVNTKWAIKNVVIKRISGSIEDSLKKRQFYQKFDSVKINFNTQKHVTVSWKEYNIAGLYKIKKTGQGKDLVFKKWKHFGFYENGSFERSQFAVFLYPFKSRDIPLLTDCSFMIKSKSEAIDCEVYYEKVN